MAAIKWHPQQITCKPKKYIVFTHKLALHQDRLLLNKIDELLQWNILRETVYMYGNKIWLYDIIC